MEIEKLRKDHPEHWEMATAIRTLSIDAVQNANSGHPGMPMGMADVVTVLFTKHLKFDASKPTWPDRDRFILSAGHGSMLLYSLLYLIGYPDISLTDLKNFRKLHSKTAGHPEFGLVSSIETTTGPLGQGLANGVGFAIAERSLRAQWGNKIVNHKTYVVAGDGCLMEGISQEAISFAGKQKLNNLIVLWDDNGITIDGEVSRACNTNQLERFKASKWSVFQCDGHNPEEIDAALIKARKSKLPSLIQCKTHIGYGSPSKQDSAASHGAPLGGEEIEKIRIIYDWPYLPFQIPERIKLKWENAGVIGKSIRMTWKNEFSKLSPRLQTEFNRALNHDLPAGLEKKIKSIKKALVQKNLNIATRKSSELALNEINKICSETIGGSADLTGSNNTITEDLEILDHDNPKGRYIYYGIREHGMAAIMNGISLHGGRIPYGGTFLAFADYARGAMRLSALIGIRVIYVMTHDSIGLGEDGPTHQPIEHLAMLRATPNLYVFRPADTIETIESWELALYAKKTPSVLALSRQNLPAVRTKHSPKNLVAKGAYVISPSQGKCEVILLASGSEVSIALEAQKMLEDENVATRVVSMPSWELFDRQDSNYKKKLLPQGPIRIAIEAGVKQGWEKWLLGERGNEKKSHFIGMTNFGTSGPSVDLYNHFRITAENIVLKAKSLLKL